MSDDIFLFEGEPSPNDIRLDFPSGAQAPGATIIVTTSVIAGKATGARARSGGGSVTLFTPSFPIPKIAFPKSARAPGALIVVTSSIRAGKASGGAAAPGARITVARPKIHAGKARGSALARGADFGCLLHPDLAAEDREFIRFYLAAS
jgi:hypothetical protein